MLSVKTAHQTITADLLTQEDIEIALGQAGLKPNTPQNPQYAVTPPAAQVSANPAGSAAPRVTQSKSGNYQAAMQSLMDAARQFAQTHNDQIKQYNPAIQQIKQISKQVGTNAASMTPQVLQQVAALTQMLQQAKNDEVKDTNFINKITQSTQSLAQAIGGGQPVSAPAGQAATPASGQTTPGQTTVSPAETAGFGVGRALKAPGRAVGRGMGKAWNAVKNVGKGIGKGVGDFASGFAMAENKTLNAKMGSAESIFDINNVFGDSD